MTIKASVARVTRTLATLLMSGVAILESMIIVAKVAGNKIVEETWLTQFKGKPLSGPLAVTKTAPRSDLEIQGVTGATISSMSVCGIVNSAIDGFRQALNP